MLLDTISKEQNTIQRKEQEKIQRDVDASYGFGELLDCLNPATFDIGCLINNIGYILTKKVNTIGLTCSLEPAITLGSTGEKKPVPGKDIILPVFYNGHCKSLFGFGPVQACDNFDYPSKAAAVCYTKCDETGKSYVASGCNGDSIWCECAGLMPPM
jgi:hypothetical protein